MAKQKTNTPWMRVLDIPASAILFASSGSLVGSALGGSTGGVIGALMGAAGGVVTEIVSQRSHQAVITGQRYGE